MKSLKKAVVAVSFCASVQGGLFCVSWLVIQAVTGVPAVKVSNCAPLGETLEDAVRPIYPDVSALSVTVISQLPGSGLPSSGQVLTLSVVPVTLKRIQ